MPREQINHPDPTPHDRYGVPEIHVEWMPGSMVQIRTTCQVEWVKQVLDVAEDDAVSFYTTALTRAEVNKMIRVLRRARDSAYGKDE